MFEHFEDARRGRRSRWAYAVLAATVGVHGLLLFGVVARGWWNIDKLTLPHEGVALAVMATPPSAPPVRKGSPHPKRTAGEHKDARRVADDTTQPVRLSAPVDTQASGGDVVGDPRGSSVGVATGSCFGPTCDPNSPLGDGGEIPACRQDAGCCGRGDCCDQSVCKETIVPQVAVAKQFVSGERKPRPDDATRAAMARDRVAQVVTAVKYCITAGGAVSRLELLKSSGYSAYDSRILTAMRRWRYRPFRVNGQATPVCSATTFIYRIAR